MPVRSLLWKRVCSSTLGTVKSPRGLLRFPQALCFPWAKASLHNSLTLTLPTRSTARTRLAQGSSPGENCPSRRAVCRAHCGKAKPKDGFLLLTAFVRGMGEVTVFFLSRRYTQSDVASELRSWQRPQTDIHSCGETDGFAGISLGNVFSLGLTLPAVSRQGNTA